MKINRVLFLSIAVLFCAAITAYATSAHTWVSGSGSDSNPCTFALPCADFQAALTQTSAGGTISVKDSGDFGSISIAQSVTIDGSNLGSIASTNVVAIYVNAPGAVNVTIRNLLVNGLGAGTNGIYFQGTGTYVVENCLVENFTDLGITFQSEAAQNGIVKNTTIIGGTVGVRTYQSIGFVPYDNVYLQNVIIQGASEAAVFSRNGSMQIDNSALTQSVVGVQLDTSAVISIANSMITSNTNGICVYAGSKLRLDNNDIYDNPTAIENCGGIIKTSVTNKTSGTILIPASDVSDSVVF